MVFPILAGAAASVIPSLFKGGSGGGGLFSGNPEKHKRVSTLRKEQMPLYNQLLQAGQNPGAGGAFGESADYYRDLLSDNSQTANAMFAPEQRRFNEDIIPQLSEQFAGMGSGALQSSGFRNASINAGTDLAERLGAIRANLRSQGAAGLANIGQQGLGNFSQDVVTQQATPGLLSSVLPGVGQGLTGLAGDYFKNLINKSPSPSSSGNNVGANSSPYGSASNYDKQFRKTGVF